MIIVAVVLFIFFFIHSTSFACNCRFGRRKPQSFYRQISSIIFITNVVGSRQSQNVQQTSACVFTLTRLRHTASHRNQYDSRVRVFWQRGCQIIGNSIQNSTLCSSLFTKPFPLCSSALCSMWWLCGWWSMYVCWSDNVFG